MKIAALRTTTVAIPLEAPLRHANGCHWGRFVRTILEVETDDGLIGYGEVGGGGASVEHLFSEVRPYVISHDPFQLEALRWKLCNPTLSLYTSRVQVHAAIEFACLDLIGKKLGVSLSALLGGSLYEAIPFAGYLFYRYPNERNGCGGEESAEDMVAYARELIRQFGFRTLKLKAGVFAPDHDIAVYQALAESFPSVSLRMDPNSVWPAEEAIRVGKAIAKFKNDYFEDPCLGMEGLKRVRAAVRIPIATNTAVTNFDQLAMGIRTRSVDVVLLDTVFWGGVRQAQKAAQICEAFNLPVSIHSSGELGIQLATMLHLGSVIPNLSFAADAHYHHITDDIIVGGKMEYTDGCIRVPSGVGLGIEIDRDKVKLYNELYRSLGGYAYDRDPCDPDWFAILPKKHYARPKARTQVVSMKKRSST